MSSCQDLLPGFSPAVSLESSSLFAAVFADSQQNAQFSLLETKSSFSSFCAARLPFLLPQILRLFQPFFVVMVSKRNFLGYLL